MSNDNDDVGTVQFFPDKDPPFEHGETVLPRRWTRIWIAIEQARLDKAEKAEERK